MENSLQSADGILQLIGLGPSLLLASFLLLTLKNPSKAVIPLLFLCSIIAAFASPVLPLFGMNGEENALIIFTVIKSILPAAIFLLILQFLRNGLPPFTYWLVLLMPILGGVLFYTVYYYGEGEICFSGQNQNCMDVSLLFSLYSIISGALILLLVMPEIARRGTVLVGVDNYRNDKFWLIVALVAFTTILLAVDLFGLTDALRQDSVYLMHTVIRLLFVFLMFASLFRVFNQQFALEMERIPNAQKLLSNEDEAIAKELERLLADQKLYREMGLNRAQVAERLKVSESQISHIINRHFECNLNVLVNKYRVEEAKERLEHEPEIAITTIAFEVGFNSIASFNRVFKEITGNSPSEYRNSKS